MHCHPRNSFSGKMTFAIYTTAFPFHSPCPSFGADSARTGSPPTWPPLPASWSSASSSLRPGAPFPTHLAPSARPGEPAAADGTTTEENPGKPGIEIRRQYTIRANKASHRFPKPGDQAGPGQRSRVLEGKPGPSGRPAESVPGARAAATAVFLCPFAPVH